MEKIKKFSRNKVLTAILLLGVTFSVVTVVLGVQPNPGHNINTLGGVVAGDLLYGSGTDVVAALADIATGNALISGGVTPGLPAWGKIGLTTHVSGILPTANGGTGIAYFTAAGPTVARTYTFPDAAATVLTSNSAVTVAQGGTGLATLTTGNVILGAGASNVSFVSPATSGNVLTANGTTWVSQAPSGGGAPTGATYITQTADATLSAEQALSTLSTGYMKVTTGTGAITSQAVPIPVSDGGTGATTLTANNVILGAGASAPTFVAPGATGNLLQSNGTTWTSAAGGVLIGHRLITASPYTPTAGTNSIVLRVVGGGGGGAGATGIASGCSAGGGGGGSGYAEKRFAGIAGAASYTVTIGAAGAAGTATGNGGVGGNSTFVCPATCTGGAVTVTANGGLGGIYTLGIAGAKTFLGGAGGAVSTLGDVNTGGQPGGSGVCVSGTVGVSGQGAPSQFGGGGTAKNTALAGTAGVGYGSGGGGGMSLSATGVVGGAGTVGVIVIDEYR